MGVRYSREGTGPPGALESVEPAVLGDARHQVFHLILKNAAVLQDQVLVPIGHVGRVDQRHVRRSDPTVRVHGAHRVGRPRLKHWLRWSAPRGTVGR